MSNLPTKFYLMRHNRAVLDMRRRHCENAAVEAELNALADTIERSRRDRGPILAELAGLAVPAAVNIGHATGQFEIVGEQSGQHDEQE